jgi:hypothetical protein
MRAGALLRSGFARALLATLVLTGALAGVARADSAVFSSTGTEQTFTVPAGVTVLQVVAIGGHGGVGVTNGSAGGAGGPAQGVAGNLSVTPGQLLYIEVGGVGAAGASGGSGGFNGGGPSPGCGGGGGASDIRTSPITAGLSPDTRLIVAAGGGGGGNGGPTSTGGAGGAGEAAGGSGDASASGGQPGTQSAGGAGGGPLFAGSAGQIGLGGNGGSGANAGGGGGAGVFGGGGGGAAGLLTGGGGGGGGASRPPAGGAKAVAGATAAPAILLGWQPVSVTGSTPVLPPVTPPAQLTPTNNFTILHPTVGSDGRIVLKLNAPGAGVFTAIAGTTTKIKKKSKKIIYGGAVGIARVPGTVKVVVKPSSAGKKARKQVKKLSVPIAITFRPLGGTAATKRTTVVVKGTKKKKKKH